MIHVGTSIGRAWLESGRRLRYLKQIGVDFVDITLEHVDGYVESGGALRRDSLANVVALLDSAGLRIERANVPSRFVTAVYLKRPEAGRAIAKLCSAIELLGEFGVPVMGLQRFEASSILGKPAGKRSWRRGRGGYRYLHFDLGNDLAPAEPPSGAPTREEIWDRTIGLYRNLVPVAERAGVKIAEHGNDPPLPLLGGVPQIFCNFADFDRLFSAVSSPHVGMTFCVGTRYESGEDIFEGIKKFGEAGRIFHVHFRNVKGTVPMDRSYSEVAPDDGDLKMLEVVRALSEAGYEGVIDYDHVMKLDGDRSYGMKYITYCVGYMKGLLAAVQ